MIYTNFNKKRRSKVSSMGVGGCSLAQGTIQNPIEN
jgi:hypothetical protein